MLLILKILMSSYWMEYFHNHFLLLSVQLKPSVKWCHFKKHSRFKDTHTPLITEYSSMVHI